VIPSGAQAAQLPGGGRLLLVVAVSSILIWIIDGAATHRMAALAAGDGSAMESWRAGLTRALPLLGCLALFVAICVGCVVFGIVAKMILSPALGARAGDIVVVVAAVTLLAFAMVRFLFFVPEVVVRGAGVTGALSNSWLLTRGHFWRVTLFGAMLVVVTIPLYLAGVAASRILPASAGLWGGAGHVAELVIVAAISLVQVPLWAALIVAAWHDLRLRAEGTDLAVKIVALPPLT
jgi:hypothetical protein